MTTRHYSALLAAALTGIAMSAPLENTEAIPGMPPEILTAANAGDAEAQCKIGDLYHHGRDAQPSFTEALRWYLRSANQGHSNAQFMLGHMYQDGEGTERNNSEAYKWFELSRLSGFDSAVYARDFVGSMLDRKQVDEAIKAIATARLAECITLKESAEPPDTLLKAANAGNADAQCLVGDFYYHWPKKKSYIPEAKRWYLRSAFQQNATAQFMLGCMFEGGGTAQNSIQTYKWFERARRSGLPAATYARDAVGAALDEKQRDEATKRATSFLERGDPAALTADAIVQLNKDRDKAKNGDLQAQVDLGVGYLYADGAPYNEHEAFRWLKTAAERGHPEAQQVLGLMYRAFDLTAVSHDDAKAVNWFRRSAKQGSIHGQNSFAVSCWQGWGTKKDPVEAYFWWLVAERGGHKGARSGWEAVEKELSPAEANETRKRAEAFQPEAEKTS